MTAAKLTACEPTVNALIHVLGESVVM